ncbi:Probable 3-beta-hydroxysteroid-Delta(8),Delta(7)-isomerase [Linum perenne]
MLDLEESILRGWDNGGGMTTSGPSGGTSRPVEEFSDNSNAFQEDLFRTPSFKATPNAFVSKRSNNVRLPDFNPLPETLSNVADEDTWMKLNHGFTIDLDSIHMTPARKVQSFPANDVTTLSTSGVVSVEGLTAVYAIAGGDSCSYILQFAISLGQLYGTVVCFITSLLEGDNFAATPFYYYAYYIGANAS